MPARRKPRGILKRVAEELGYDPRTGRRHRNDITARREITGHQGLAMGHVQDREDAEEPFTEEELERWSRRKELGDVVATDFVYNHRPVNVVSSNVAAAVYFIEKNILVLTFKGGARYAYDNVTEQEAIDFIQSLSKGSWSWQHLRVLGSRTAHAKPYRKLND